MAKRKKGEEDWRRHHKFKEENQKLRKEISKLRKLVKETYLDKLEEKLHNKEECKPKLPLCETCGNDDIIDVHISRADGEFVIKMCNNCDHRGNMKRVKQ